LANNTVHTCSVPKGKNTCVDTHVKKLAHSLQPRITLTLTPSPPPPELALKFSAKRFAVIDKENKHVKFSHLGGFCMEGNRERQGQFSSGSIIYKQAFNLRLFQAYGVNEKHDIYLCREIMVVEPFQFKKGTVARGQLWTKIAVLK